jgi:hypothetical protein
MITNKISRNVELLSSLLYGSGAVSVIDVLESSGLPDSEFYLALGWLSREGKLQFYDKGKRLMMELVA